MPAVLRPTTLCALTLLAGCSIDFDRFLYTQVDGDAGAPPDTGVVGPTDLGVAPTDTASPPVDTGVAPPDAGRLDTGVVPPVDTGTPPRDTGVVPPVDAGPADTGAVPPVDTGVVVPTGCRAPYLVAVAENLDANAARLLRWSFADDRACADLPLGVAHPRAVGVTFDTLSDLGGPQLIVVNDQAVSVVDPTRGEVIRDLPVAGQPRSVFDIISNGAGSFAVAYSFMGDSPPGTVGNVRVFDHRGGTLRQVQSWERNQQLSINLLWAAAYPGNQGQYLQVMPSTTTGYSTFVTSPSSTGFHPRSSPPIIADRNNVRSLHAYRTVDRRGHYAQALSGGSGTPVVYLASTSAGSSTLSNTFVPGVRCSGEPCPSITRAVAFPDEDDAAAAVCELSGTEYAIVRVGGASTGCHLLDTSALGGRWRINDVAVMPR